MTTKHSPLSVLKKQADRIAALLKAIERGERVDIQFAEKVEAARTQESLKFGIAMDDKIIAITMPWDIIQ